jgi:hypothetical protein
MCPLHNCTKQFITHTACLIGRRHECWVLDMIYLTYLSQLWCKYDHYSYYYHSQAREMKDWERWAVEIPVGQRMKDKFLTSTMFKSKYSKPCNGKILITSQIGDTHHHQKESQHTFIVWPQLQKNMSLGRNAWKYQQWFLCWLPSSCRYSHLLMSVCLCVCITAIYRYLCVYMHI